MHRPDKARIFFALWPDKPTQKALHGIASQYASTYKARAMKANTLHITLLFLGDVERKRLPLLIEAAGKVSQPAFKLILDQLSFWPRIKLTCATMQKPEPALNQLITSLKEALTPLGFVFDNKPYIMHVTLLRNVMNMLATQPITPVDWNANTFVLAESTLSKQGSSYQILEKWSLTPTPNAE